MVEDLTAHNEFNFALRFKLAWSKNVHEERDVPNQIMLGSMDHPYCVLLALAVFFKTHFESGMGAGLFVFSLTDDI